jgi:SAM-dependent methyltransferase
MTWEETIQYIRRNKEYEQLVIDAYFSEDLEANVERYRNTEEFKATLQELRKVNPKTGLSILDLGAGNGISTIAFALEGYKVTALEPDPSETIGAGAIKILIEKYQLPNVSILECYAEDIPLEKAGFDFVFARQAMHHAYHLENFIRAAYSTLNKGGVLMTIRDHVVSTPAEKQEFLKMHPLHKFYGGENAFSEKEYGEAMTKAGFKILKILKPSESVINYYPWSKELLKKKLGVLGNVDFIVNSGWILLSRRWENLSGRLYTFIAQKP